MTRRVPTVRELREELEDEAEEALNATQQGQREFDMIRWEADTMAAMCREVNPKRPASEWVMVLRLAAFKIEEKAHPHRIGKVRRR